MAHEEACSSDTSCHCEHLKGARQSQPLTAPVEIASADQSQPRNARKGESSLPPAFLNLYLPQGFIIKAEVVGYLVAHYFLYFCFNFTAKAALRLYRLLKDTYLIRQNQSVPPAPPSLGHTLVKTKQLGGMTVFNLSQLPWCGPIFYHNINIFQFALKLRWQTIDCPRYESLKFLPLHIYKSQILPTGVRTLIIIPLKASTRQANSE
jgi:hypothetical protein